MFKCPDTMLLLMSGTGQSFKQVCANPTKSLSSYFEVDKLNYYLKEADKSFKDYKGGKVTRSKSLMRLYYTLMNLDGQAELKVTYCLFILLGFKCQFMVDR